MALCRSDVLIINKIPPHPLPQRQLSRKPTTLIATGDVTVQANSQEDIFTLSANVGIGGSTGVAGAAVVIVQDTNTRAFIGVDATLNPAPVGIANVKADGSIYVSADSSTAMDAAAGAVAGAKGSGDTEAPW